MTELLFNDKNIFFWIGFLIIVLSLLFQFLQKEKPALLLLVAAGFFFFFYATLEVPFLNLWDERFHALVAKNFLYHFFIPTLYDEELFKMSYGWATAHIWVHKFPLFLWQGTLFYKIFGVNEIAFRLPGALLCSIMVYGGYRSGKLIYNQQAGYITGILIATSSYLWQLVSGFAPLDQNDLVFTAYISLSIWTMIEYVYSGKLYWALLTAIFSGFAILTKWVVGLLVYLIWSAYTFFKYKWDFKQYAIVFWSALLSIAISIPWQVYIFMQYPFEAKREYEFNLHHLNSVIDSQGGPLYYHFTYMGLIFGSLVPVFLAPSLVFFYLKGNNRKMNLSLIISIIFVYLFYSIAKTKMQSFTAIIILPMYLSLAVSIVYFWEWVSMKIKSSHKVNSLLFLGVFLILVCMRLNFNSLKANNGFWGKDVDCYDGLKHNKAIFQRLNVPSNAVLFNIPGCHPIEAMFYTGLPAYGFIPDEVQYKELKDNRRVVAIFNPSGGKLPDYLANDKDVIILKDTLHPCE